MLTLATEAVGYGCSMEGGKVRGHSWDYSKMLRTSDANNDGAVTRQEQADAMRSFDANSNGKLEEAEQKKLMATMQAGVRHSEGALYDDLASYAKTLRPS